MASGCRDCSRCTEAPVESLLWGPLRALGTLLFGWNVGLFWRTCPQCGHRMALHRQVDGRFAD